MTNDSNAKSLEGLLQYLGLKCQYVKCEGNVYYFNLLDISQYNKKYITSLIDKASAYFHADLSFHEQKETHFAIKETPTQSLYYLENCIMRQHYEKVVIGVDENSKDFAIDFEKIPHLLIAGTTGSGKSVLIHNLILNLYLFYGHHKDRFKAPNIIIIDPKGIELDMYKNCQCTQFIGNVNEAIEVLKDCVEEMDKRYQKHERQYKDMYIIIDELADLMLRSKYEVEESIVRLAQKGRACHIHLIVATQRPTIDVCSGLIKANMPYRIGLKVASVRDSVVILDHKGLETLRGNGDSICRFGLEEKRVQIAYPSKELISKVVSILSR